MKPLQLDTYMLKVWTKI